MSITHDLSMREPMDYPMAEQLDNEWGNSKQTSPSSTLVYVSIHQLYNVGCSLAPTKGSLADADWLNTSSVGS